jgi:hypothetical protein
MLRWVRRRAEVPGVSYKGVPEINRTQLPGHNFEPTLHKIKDGEDGAEENY